MPLLIKLSIVSNVLYLHTAYIGYFNYALMCNMKFINQCKYIEINIFYRILTLFFTYINAILGIDVLLF